MKIGLLGDVMLGRGVTEALATTQAEELWSPGVRAVATECELLVCNLECCISERGAPTELVPGKPFFLRAPPRAVGALRAVGARAASLANNHHSTSARRRSPTPWGTCATPASPRWELGRASTPPARPV
jgi:poly-gamma-glutamate capsule biosynthesis protein CapA/YwtB (metallophosphatase superfamily)